MSDDPLFDDGLRRALGILRSDDKTHYEALGRFISAFANAEGILHVVARKLSGLNDDKARLIFAGLRLTDVIDRIRSFIQLERGSGKPADESFDDIEACLEQLGHISGRRHNIVHRGATYFGGTLFVSNSMIAKTLAGIENEIISEDELAAMAGDCGVIFLRLNSLCDASIINEKWRDTLRQQPWRYKPPPPKPRNPRRPDSPESPKRQPRASRASRRREALARRQKS